ncbi:hypothetical protein [Acinetobacter haemolyticus]|uniref:hypothetical protein n=1 Tax=Acinetobacter haemolyticus TaxID=29430 RepID=UPI002DB78F34|nr:hypothetical protein [Acinetobacter haemolyticus]MEB6677086.1 hypothetical protein [Acinetobacter haemolyticus]
MKPINLKFLYPSQFFFSIFILTVFITLNISAAISGGGNTYIPILLLFILSAGFFLPFKIINGTFRVYKKFIFLLIFIFYFFLKAVFQYDDLSRFFAYTLGTSGGIILFYMIGCLVSNLFFKIYDLKKSFQINLLLFLLLIFFNLCLYYIFKSIYSNLRVDILLISDLDAGYQRSGDLITILFVIGSFIVYYLFESIKGLYLSVATLVLYLFMLFFVVMSSQLIGSNKGFVIPLIISIILFYCIFFKVEMVDKEKFRYFKFLAIALLLSAVSYVVINIDFDALRFSGYGSGEESSLTSRIQIFKNNFYTHFSYSPYIGHLEVDSKLTGAGTYVHSFLFFCLTHFGIIGLGIIGVYLVLCFNFLSGNSNIQVFKRYVFVFILAFAVIATSLFWPVIWFVIGLLCPVFVCANSEIKK